MEVCAMRFRTFGWLHRSLALSAGLLAPAALAQYGTGFEAPDYTGSPEGVVLTGQDGWYLPAGIDALVFTYADNALGFPANPEGGEQFIGGVSAGGTSFARAQHDVDFSVAEEWIFSYDIAVTYTGQIPAALNLASFSLQDSVVARHFISLNNFMDLNDPSLGWKAEFNVWDAAGAPIVNQSPGAAWTNLANNHWYRLTASVNFTTNTLSHVTITDLETGETTHADVNWYLTGGETPALPLPTAIRCFVGGSAGDTAGYDNVSAARDEDPGCYADFTGEGELDLFDFLAFVNAFNAGDEVANCDGEGGLDLFDFLCYTNAFNAGC
jgi:hypothetical protein